MATINGTAGNDNLAGTGSNDTINGLGGNDTLAGSAGTDFYDGGAGFDTLDLRATLTGLTSNLSAGTLSGGFNGTFASIERVWSGDGNDSLTGTAAADSFSARGGSDTLAGGAGIDTLWGGTQADTFIFRETGTANADSIGDWASGSDKLLLEGAVMAALGASGNFSAADARFAANSTGTAQDASDRVIFETDTRQIWYDADGNGAGARQLIATLQSGATLAPTDIVVEGGAGPAPIVGTEGNDSLVGTDGNDTIDGRGGNDTLVGMDGNDSLLGGAGDDVLDGLSGSIPEFIYSVESPSAGRVDTIDGGLGNDTYRPSAEDVLSDPGGTETVIASDFNWTLGAGFENLVLNNDASESDFIGIGNELANHISATWAGSRLEGRGGDDTLIGAEGTGTDRLFGGEGNDFLDGRWTHDELDGGPGNDTLYGGTDFEQDDTLTGGAGADTFVPTNPHMPAEELRPDQITDFASGSDRIQFDGNEFSNTGPSGNFTAGDARFAANSTGTAQDASDRVVYNTMNGQLWYDADGTGTGARQLIATLQGAPTLAAADIEIINGSGGGGGGGGQVINGTAGNDSLAGGPGNDTINGLAGSDTLVGLGGDDVLDGGEGLDTMDGGLGNDTYYSERLASGFLQGDVLIDAGGTDTLITHGGTLPDGIENMTLRPADEPFFEINAGGNALNNFIRNESDVAAWLDGAEGDDTIIGGTGVDYLFLSDGNDSIDGGGGVNRLFADSAVVIDFRTGTATSASGTTSFTDIDEAYGSFFNDQLIADDLGRDLDGGGGDDTVTGGAGGDSLRGDGGFDHLDTIEGDDLIFGGAGNDFLAGGDGSDTLDGGAGNDTLRGVGELSNDPEGFPDGADRFLFTVAPGSANADLIQDFTLAEDEIVLDGTVHANSGASGNFTAGDGRFWASGTGAAHDADDRVIYNTSNGQLWYDADGSGAGTAQLIATLRWFDSPASLAATDIEIINGSTSGQVINGTAGADSLAGTGGNDTINGLGGNDTLAGSAGTDVYDGGTGFDTLDLRGTLTGLTANLSAGTLSGGFNGTFVNIERVWSGDGNDSLTGTAAANSFSARGGNDSLAGGGGIDTLWGGTGADTFIFREAGTVNADSIGDWASGSDKLHLDDSAFAAIGAAGNFAAGDGRFWAAAGATAGHDANDRVVYNTSTGSLYYDADGSGSGASQLIATVQSGATVAATDIVVI